jgi:hypothetical protein
MKASRTWEFKAELESGETVLVRSFCLQEAVAKIERMFRHRPNSKVLSCISTGL